MYIIVNTYTAPSMSTMVTSSATPSTSQYQVPQLNMHQYGFIDSFLIKMHYERKRLAQISNYAVATTPSYHIHCQGCHQQWTPPTVIHCRSYTPEAPYLFHTSQYQVPQLNMHQYGFIDSFLIKMHYERKRLAQISNYAVATTPSYHIHCQGCHQQWTPPTVIHCRSYTPEAPYLFQ
ncbi:hypothetical protein T4C_7879 [Trichinella pseudospiralis]|uniref:Uncharacterized protein n=2 Tax=Trichinella pseudospiralis TaxID=6337 RepID=A0A0V1JRP3_TRIPS|nr:hypothetical protein T4C_7879 [Trichinella pseudospiralis]